MKNTKNSRLRHKRINIILVSVLCVLMLTVVTGCTGRANRATECTFTTEDGRDVVTFDGIKHNYIVDLPQNTAGAPLIVMLHGYGESAEGMRRDVALEKEGNARGYAVAYVTGAPSPEDTTSANGWNSGIGISSNDDVAFLCAFAQKLCEIYSLDESRVFAVGFSNGAFMTHRLATEANDTFAAIVSVAGMMPESVWNDRPDNCKIGVLQITGEKDDVIPKNIDGSAKYSKAPAIEDVLEYYIDGNELSAEDAVNVGKKSTLEKNSSSTSGKQVWHLFVPGGRHSWPDEQITGFNTNQIIIDFLETQ